MVEPKEGRGCAPGDDPGHGKAEKGSVQGHVSVTELSLSREKLEVSQMCVTHL